MVRGRLPSVPELDERLRRIEERTDPRLPLLSSTPPAVQWLQRKAVKVALRIALAAALGAATWWGGWIARDCQGPRHVPYPSAGSNK